MFKLGALALLALVAAIFAAVVAIPATADASSLSAAFTKTSSWGNGFIGQYTIVNRGTTAIDGWTLEFDLPPGQSIASAWSTKLTSTGAHQVLTPEAWTRSIPAGGSVRLGFEAAASNAEANAGQPSNCAINGQPCASTAPGTATTVLTPTTTAPTTTTTAPSPTTTQTTTTTTTTSTVAPSPNAPANGLNAAFTKASDWGSGFVGEYVIANGGSTPVDTWQLEFDLTPGQALTSAWSARMSPSANHYVLTPEAWTRSIAPGSSVKIGFQGTSAGGFTAPINCRLNGQPCAGASPPAPTSPPPPSSGPSPGGNGPDTGPSGATRPGFAPYVDMTLSADSLAAKSTASGVKRFTLAFIVSGAPCQASWGGFYGLADTSIATRIADLQAAGGEAIISFGGAINQELARTCPTVDALTAQYQAVIDRYGIRDLDFDIEGADQTDASSLDRRFKAIARLQAAGLAAVAPVRISLTLPVMPSGLTAAGLGVVQAAIANGVDVGTVNVMTMDYFDPSLAPYAGKLGQYAIDAVTAVKAQLKILYPGRSDAALWRMVGATPMIGINDNPAEVFTTSDAAQLTAFARQNSLGRLSMWSINRDGPCPQPTSTTQNTCSGVGDPQWAFSAAFLAFGV